MLNRILFSTRADRVQMLESTKFLDLKYYSLSRMKGLAELPLDLQQKAFDFWKEQWSLVFNKLETPRSFNENDFFTQDKVTFLTSHDEVIAILTIQEFDIQDFLQNSYFEDYTIGFYKRLKEGSIRKLNCMRYILIDENFRYKKIKINLSAVLLGLALKHQKEEQKDVSICLAREDNNSSSLCMDFGMQPIELKVHLHNVLVKQMICLDPHPHHNKQINNLIDYLWLHRNNQVTNNTEEKNVRLRKRIYNQNQRT